MAGMFGVIISGRLVQTNFEQVAETKFLITIMEADAINHIVVFLTGATPFPEGLGGSVYFSFPDSNGSPSWHLLGIITNTKPSAIFKISGLKKNGTNNQPSLFSFGQNAVSHNAQIGISVEPLEQIKDLTVASPSSDNHMKFSQAMCENLYNFASSFAQGPSQIVPNPSEQYLPLSTLTKWYENFTRKLQQNPNFWKK
ncbi:protein OPI10 homolog [Oratosquilla oratoria]|uniref:protein OPI10 homolog n=1 Tax=Oratosquilla oratoria TaxID=337810 RepID=UPI003F761142